MLVAVPKSTTITGAPYSSLAATASAHAIGPDLARVGVIGLEQRASRLGRAHKRLLAEQVVDRRAPRQRELGHHRCKRHAAQPLEPECSRNQAAGAAGYAARPTYGACSCRCASGTAGLRSGKPPLLSGVFPTSMASNIFLTVSFRHEPSAYSCFRHYTNPPPYAICQATVTGTSSDRKATYERHRLIASSSSTTSPP